MNKIETAKRQLMVQVLQHLNRRTSAPDMEGIVKEFYSAFEGEGERRTAIEHILGDTAWKPILVGSRLKLNYDLEKEFKSVTRSDGSDR